MSVNAIPSLESYPPGVSQTMQNSLTYKGLKSQEDSFASYPSGVSQTMQNSLTYEKEFKSQKTKKSNDIQIVVEEEAIQITSEMVLECSVESLYQWLRFKKFTTIPTEGLKELFIKMVNVPLKHETILHDIIDAINEGNFDELKNIIDNYHISDLHEQLAEQLERRGIKLKFKHDWNKVFELYFSTNDENLATAILRNFMFLESVSQEAYECYIKWVETLTEEQRKMNLIQYPYNRINV